MRHRPRRSAMGAPASAARRTASGPEPRRGKRHAQDGPMPGRPRRSTRSPQRIGSCTESSTPPVAFYGEPVQHDRTPLFVRKAGHRPSGLPISLAPARRPGAAGCRRCGSAPVRGAVRDQRMKSARSSAPETRVSAEPRAGRLPSPENSSAALSPRPPKRQGLCTSPLAKLLRPHRIVRRGQVAGVVFSTAG